MRASAKIIAPVDEVSSYFLTQLYRVAPFAPWSYVFA